MSQIRKYDTFLLINNGHILRSTYDSNGNQLSGNGLITYDARGRQSTWTDGLTTASYTYYPIDLRKSKTVGATTTNFVWDGQNMVYEYKGSNTTGGTAYYYGLTLISQGNYAYYLYNGHGDVVQLVTSTGTLGRSYDYDAFGNEENPSASDTNPFRYCAQYFDKESGTIYLRARYYAPGLGRFTQQDGWAFADPAVPASLNLYTYCVNDPILFVDPSGNSIIVTVLIFTIAGAAINAGIDAGVQLYQNDWQFDQVNWRSVGASAASGALTSGLGALTGGASLGVGATLAVNGLIEGAGYGVYHLVNGSEASLEGFVGAFAVGSAFGIVDIGIDNYLNGIKGKVHTSGDYYVYRSIAPDGSAQYVGITNDMVRRAGEHRRQKGIEIEEFMTNLSKEDARAVEQYLIDFYGLRKNGGTLMNRINSIAITNPIYESSQKQASKIIRENRLKL